MAATREYRRQTVDFLGFLANKLRDLQGFPTVINELLQNSDDAPGVTSACFDVRNDALIVTNNGAFRQEDFDNLENISSRGKRDEADTTGAFGVGLIALYQVCDSMELKSAGWHYTIRPDEPEDQRIVRESIAPTDSTVFRFPWAFDPDTRVRSALDVEPVSKEDPKRFADDLEGILPIAALFLRKIEALEVRRHGRLRTTVRRVQGEDEALLDVNGVTSVMRLLQGAFESEAESLRAKVGARIPEKLTAGVSVAVEEQPEGHGLLYAWLPTQQSCGLPIHINADFFTSSDRKRIILEDDFRSEWNRAAIGAAAATLAANLEEIRGHLGPKGLWALVSESQQLANEVEKGEADRIFSAFWDATKLELKRQELIFTTAQEWCRVDEAYFLAASGHEKHIPLLEKLGIALVDTDLRPMHTLMTRVDVGVPVLNSERLAKALEAAGLDEDSTPIGDTAIRTTKALKELWELIDSTVRLDEQQNRPQSAHHFSGCALSRTKQGDLHFPESLFRADAATIRLFEKLDSELHFLDDLGMPDCAVARLSPAFGVEEAIALLEDLDPENLSRAWAAGSWSPKSVFRWFEARKDELLEDDDLRDRLRDIAICPAGAELKPLSELVLPGTFEDPLRLTDLVNVVALGGRKDFLKDMGVQELSLEVYAREHIPDALDDEELPARVRRQVVAVLAEHVGVLIDQPGIHEALAGCELIECEDGVFRRASEVYLKSKDTTEPLGDYAHYAKGSTGLKGGKRSLYSWLGVASAPHASDVCGRIEGLVAKPPTKDRVAAVARIFRYLGQNWGTIGKRADDYLDLASLEWLPGTKDRAAWFEPDKVYAIYQDYLFATEGNFLALPRPEQIAGRDLMQFLGVQFAPTVGMVAQHLLHCAEGGVAVNEQVYRFLNDHVDDPAIAQLEDETCIDLKDVGYVRPNQVFWGQHPFGRFRYQLGDNLIQYRVFFNAIGVREDPVAADAIEVLGDIRAAFRNNTLDEDTISIVNECWRVLTDGLGAREIDEEAINDLSSLKSIVNAQQVLQEPRYMFLDDRPGLVQRFPEVANDLVRRIQGIWPAMEAAGVQRLSLAVERRLLDCADPVEDTALRDRIQSRRLHIVRVLDSNRDQLGDFDISTLDDLFYFKTNDIAVQYVLRYFRRTVSAEPEPAAAFLDMHHNSLYYVPREASPQWASLARELTYALQLDQDASNVVAAIKDVLAADTPEEAETVLDEFGFPPLERQAWTPQTGAVHEELGAQQADETGLAAEVEWPEGTEPEEPAEGLSPEEALKVLLGGEAPEPEPPPEDMLAEKEPVGTGSGSGSSAGGSGSSDGRAPKKRGRLRSYVMTDDEGSSDEDNDDESTEPENEADPKGIERVVEYEISQGRRPKVMPHTNPGYDIESSSAQGKIERYIEVKSLTGEWVEFGAGMTRPQFKKAQELGDKFWLYVVEYATDEEACAIYCIQDPARKVDQFMYDDEWKKTAKAVWTAQSESVGSDG